MKTTNLYLSVLTLVVFAASTAALADWNPDDPYKTESLYMPDLSDKGMDVNASYSTNGRYILFDDFLCSESGPITDIHLWGSWLNDIMPDGGPSEVTFILSIHENNSGSPDLADPWIMTFRPGEFSVRLWQNNLTEGWMGPGGEYTFPGDTICWQYNFYIPEDIAFMQEFDERYWLNVAAIPTDESTYWGWKTTAADTEGAGNWARWTYELSPWDDIHEPMGEGNLLIYPPGHAYEPDPADYYGTSTGVNFSFVITPEPASTTILIAGALGLIYKRRFLRK